MRSLVLFFLISSLTLFAQEGRGGRGGAAPPPKNLKVLPADINIMKTMGEIRAALGVQCNYCHGAADAGRGGAGRGPGAQVDFASDENPHKLVARNMMHMMEDINARFPDGKAHVTCYTCHHGESTPKLEPPAETAAPK